MVKGEIEDIGGTQLENGDGDEPTLLNVNEVNQSTDWK